MQDVIVALATAPIKSALAIVRVSGENCFNVVSKITSISLEKLSKRGIHHSLISFNDKLIDDVVILSYEAPKSFTGENSVEIICHGSVLIANEIIEALIANGARMALNGEYSSRAFLNKKIDLIQAEAINDMINSTTKEAKSLSLFSLEGETSKLVDPIKTKIADLLSLIEVNIDYPEYLDIEVANKEKVITDCTYISNLIFNLIKSGKEGQIIRDGVKIVIAGRPNLGKSSLLNVLINEDKAIVTNIPGTTRDIVEGEFVYKGIKYKVIDTAGIRESSDVVEQIGVDKALQHIKEADIVIGLVESCEDIIYINNIIGEKLHILVQNKSDLISTKEEGRVYVSAKNHDVRELLEALNKLVGVSDEAFNTPSLNNARQIGLLEQIKNIIDSCINDAENDLPIDLISSSLQDAYHLSLQLIGEGNNINIDKEIFARFCVGK